MKEDQFEVSMILHTVYPIVDLNVDSFLSHQPCLAEPTEIPPFVHLLCVCGGGRHRRIHAFSRLSLSPLLAFLTSGG
jgi:hypothetical protein